MALHPHRAIAAAKQAVASLLDVTGLLRLWIRHRYRREPLVLMYHRVLPPEEQAASWSHPGIIVDVETFERHLRLLGRLFTVISIDQYIASMERPDQTFERPPCLITFDDGWRDTYEYAWPVLARHGMTALVFLPAGYVGTGEMFWQEKLGSDLFAVWQRGRNDAAFQQRAGASLAAWGLDAVLGHPEEGIRFAISEAVRRRKTDTPEQLQQMAAAISVLGQGLDGTAVDAFMAWPQVREMAREGIAFGGHGTRHLLLTTMTRADAVVDITQSRDALRTNLGADPRAFSYPNGNWNTEVADTVRDAGFRVAFTTPQHRAAGRYARTRVNVHQQAAATDSLFLARIIGLF